MSKPVSQRARSASVVHFERPASSASLQGLLLDKEERKRQFCELYDPSQPVVADEFKEQRRRQHRTVFDFARWQTHRSTTRYVRHTIGKPLWRMVRQLALPLAYVFAVSVVVSTYQAAREAEVLPPAFPNLQLDGREPFALTSFALSLLLVFRTNASYSRWLDARKSWGLVLNRSRDLARQALTWAPEGEGEVQGALCRWTAAFSVALKCHLRVGCNALGELQEVLQPHELPALREADHYPNFILQVLSRLVSKAHVAPAAAIEMDRNLTALEDCLGTCERILKTPIPLSYTRHTSRFMVIWLSMMPFTLWEPCGWATPALCVLIAFLLLGIEEIGVDIEEPFSILALEAICGTVQRNIQELQRLNALAGECWREGGSSVGAGSSSEGIDGGLGPGEGLGRGLLQLE